MRNRWFVLCALAALIATLAACGGHSASDKNATSTALAGGPTNTAAPAAASGGNAAPAPAGTPATGGMNAPAAPAAGGDANTVNVQAKDFAFTIDKSTVNAGSVTFNLMNMGPSPHNFQIMGNGVMDATMTINMGEKATLKANLKPGTYMYICNVPGHQQLGMMGMITVK